MLLVETLKDCGFTNLHLILFTGVWCHPRGVFGVQLLRKAELQISLIQNDIVIIALVVNCSSKLQCVETSDSSRHVWQFERYDWAQIGTTRRATRHVGVSGVGVLEEILNDWRIEVLCLSAECTMKKSKV